MTQHLHKHANTGLEDAKNRDRTSSAWRSRCRNILEMGTTNQCVRAPHRDAGRNPTRIHKTVCVGPTQKPEKMGAHSSMAVCKPYRNTERNQSRLHQVSMCGRGSWLAPHPQISWCAKDLRLPEIWEGHRSLPGGLKPGSSSWGDRNSQMNSI